MTLVTFFAYSVVQNKKGWTQHNSATYITKIARGEEVLTFSRQSAEHHLELRAAINSKPSKSVSRIVPHVYIWMNFKGVYFV